MTSEQIRDGYIRACRAFGGKPAVMRQVMDDLQKALHRGELSDVDYKVVHHMSKTFGVIRSRGSVSYE
jgi:hypothetical protein